MAHSAGPSHGGASLRAKIALCGGSSGRLAMAPAIQWCRKIWTATRRPALSLVSRAEFLMLWGLSKPVECESRNKPQGPRARAHLRHSLYSSS
eukprot:6988754-Pyramimonas_sp.AAC.1